MVYMIFQIVFYLKKKIRLEFHPFHFGLCMRVFLRVRINLFIYFLSTLQILKMLYLLKFLHFDLLIFPTLIYRRLARSSYTDQEFRNNQKWR